MLKSKTLVILFLICSFMLTNCTLTEDPPTPFPTSTATPTNCPQIILDRTPVPVTIKPYLIIALFEDAYQQENNEDIEMLKRTLQEKSEPGDYFLMLRMEPLTLSSAVFFQDYVDLLSPPSIPPTPTKYPTFTPIPTPASTSQTTVGQTAEANHIIQTMIASALTATHQSGLHDCAMQVWETQYSATQTSYENDKRTQVKELLTEIPNFSGEPISKTAVWNGLQHATLVMTYECSKYVRCILLIFSDMQEVNPEPGPSTVYLPLDGDSSDKIDILVIMRDCPFLFNGECGRWKNFWGSFFDSRSTKANFINGNSEQVIKSMLER